MNDLMVADGEDEAPALPVYQVALARPALAGWLRRLLTPVVAACRLRGSMYPLELRPTGLWAGWAAGSDAAPDRRVAISNLALHRTKRSLVTLYLHEVAHQLVGVEQHGHDAPFFAVNLMLLLRVSAAPGATPEGGGALADTMQLYDLTEPPAVLQNEPDSGVTRAIAWAIAVAHELAPTRLAAEEAAAEVCSRYEAWIRQLEAAPAAAAAAARAQAAAAVAAAAKAKANRDELQRANELLRTVSFSLGVAGVLVLFMLLKLSFGGTGS